MREQSIINDNNITLKLTKIKYELVKRLKILKIDLSCYDLTRT